MNLISTTSAKAIERGLCTEAMKPARASSGGWTLKPTNGAGHRVNVQRNEHWLRFTCADEASAVAASPETLRHAVIRNAGLPAGIRLALDESGRLEFRSDLLLAEETDVEKRVRETVETFEQVREGVPIGKGGPATGSPGELEQLCEEAGWSGVRRASGRLTVALGCTPGRQATVTPDGDGLRLQIDVADPGADSPACRTAAAALALEISGAMRLVRAGGDAASGKLVFEISWQAIPSIDELDAGLGSLSAAVGAAGDSFTVLQNEKLADDYLTVRGWSADLSKPTTK